MKCYAITHPGRVRDNNEDSYFIPKNGECFAAVCDGMGGANAGEVASGMTVDGLRDALQGGAPDQNALAAAIKKVNADVYFYSRSHVECAGMGTTLTALAWLSDRVIMAHVGDSRLYRFDGETLRQLSRDHTYVQQLLDEDEITPEQARNHPQRNLITRAIGTEPTVNVDTAAFERSAGLVYLLCSDGLTNMVSDDKLCRILRKGTPKEQLFAMVDEANKNGGTDNITAVLIVDEEGMT